MLFKSLSDILSSEGESIIKVFINTMRIKQLLILILIVAGIFLVGASSYAKESQQKNSFFVIQRNMMQAKEYLEEMAKTAHRCWEKMLVDLKKTGKDFIKAFSEGKKNIADLKVKIDWARDAFTKKNESFKEFLEEAKLSQSQMSEAFKEKFQSL